MRVIQLAFPVADPGKRPSYRIVVVDDHQDAAVMVCTVLRLFGHDALSATTGELGLAAIARHRPQIAILDIGLPDISGYELAQQLREAYGAELYLAAITGWGDVADRARALEAGFDQHVLKPITSAMLREVVAAATSRFERSA